MPCSALNDLSVAIALGDQARGEATICKSDSNLLSLRPNRAATKPSGRGRNSLDD
jgi:hypothetical protein